MKKFFNKLLYGGGIVFDLTKWVIFVLVVFLLFFKFLFSVFIVDGESMEPNLHDKEIVLLQDSKESDNPERGEVVAVLYPGDPEHKKYVKRIVGLPGETVSIKNGLVYINDVLLDESYLSYNVKTEPYRISSWKLEENEYFLMGDNRGVSNDSRYFGPVEKRFFDGKAISIIFPRFHLIGD